MYLLLFLNSEGVVHWSYYIWRMLSTCGTSCYCCCCVAEWSLFCNMHPVI